MLVTGQRSPLGRQPPATIKVRGADAARLSLPSGKVTILPSWTQTCPHRTRPRRRSRPKAHVRCFLASSPVASRAACTGPPVLCRRQGRTIFSAGSVQEGAGCSRLAPDGLLGVSAADETEAPQPLRWGVSLYERKSSARSYLPATFFPSTGKRHATTTVSPSVGCSRSRSDHSAHGPGPREGARAG